MKSLFMTLVTFCAMVVFGVYAWNSMRKVPLVAPAVGAKQGNDTAKSPLLDAPAEAQNTVKFVGPLATYMDKSEGAPGSDAKSGGGPGLLGLIENLESPAPAKPNPADLVGGSVVGTTNTILHKKFRVRAAAQLGFVVPAHAATPHLRGTYQSFVSVGGAPVSDSAADIEFLVLNDQQFAEFVHGHNGDATFAVDEAHVQEVNTSLPPTIDEPVKYHLVFRNASRQRQSKLVEADFRMEF
jgi:hypothetical protein